MHKIQANTITRFLLLLVSATQVFIGGKAHSCLLYTLYTMQHYSFVSFFFCYI